MSVEPPMVLPPKSPLDTDKLREMRERFGLERTERMVVLAGRELARRVVGDRPDVSPSGAVYLDCSKVEMVTPSFFDELVRLWPRVQPVGMREDVAITWGLVRDAA